MQIVYLSNRPSILSKTLRQVDRFMSFIDEIVIICPKHIAKEFSLPDRLETKFIFEEELYAKAENKPDRDHQSINYFLRSQAIKQSVVADVFIMSDDDSRPIRPIQEDLYLMNMQYANFYFYELSEWHFLDSEFDRGQQNSYALLKYCGLPTLSYAAHMPQIIDKNIYLNSSQFFEKYSSSSPICEWTSYFNYGIKHFSDKFQSPDVCKTLCWPKLPGEWPQYVDPDTYFFENYYPELYTPKAVFEGLEEIPGLENNDLVNFEKIKRLRLLECGRMIGPAMKNDPWRNRTLRNRLFYRFLRMKNEWNKLVSLKDRTTRNKILSKGKSN